ncbi:putative membrane protein [Rhizobium aquaticum]|uniref:Membrane protein n=1 Tax=Rhizobium aquaticum TaxID=1549636 RepID=A0ABV2IWI1_9HYPH
MSQDNTAEQPIGRLHWMDALRGVALITMATYHLTWDLEFFHYLEPGTASSLPLKIYARSIASSFLFLAGFSLYLAHGRGIRWQPFWMRFAKIVAAALVVTVATFYAMYDEFIYFGILHNIAAASLIGLLFLRAPPLLTLAVAAASIAAPIWLHSSVFNTPPLYWLGLSESVRRSNDYVPILPWLGPFLIGIAAAQLLIKYRLIRILAGDGARNFHVFSGLSTVGRHSLAFYLLHQPILIAIVWCIAQVFPAASPDPALSYMQSCKAACAANQSESFCSSFCGCTLTELKSQNLFDVLERGELDVNNDARVLGISRQCTRTAQGQE